MSEFMRQNPNNILDNHNSVDRDSGEDSIFKQGVKINRTKNGIQDAAKADWESSKKSSKLNNGTIEIGIDIKNEGSGKCGTEKKKKKNKFDWDSAISGILSKKPEKIGSGYKIKTLKKKLVKVYCSQVTGSTPEKVDAKVLKKLSKFQSKYDVSSDGKRIMLKSVNRPSTKNNVIHQSWNKSAMLITLQ
jgi:hypothetical protein